MTSHNNCLLLVLRNVAQNNYSMNASEVTQNFFKLIGESCGNDRHRNNKKLLKSSQKPDGKNILN